MTLVVQKYGGSSLATTDRIEAIANRIRNARVRGDKIIVVVSAMGGTTDDLLALAHSIHPRPPTRELDMLLTVGERISMALLSMALEKRGIPAISFTGSQSGIITDTRHAGARILEVRGARIAEALESDRVAIVAGFQGVSSQREVTTLGRGGSDTTATALAAAFEAGLCEICTDVEGVFTADPRLVPQARRLEHLDYDSMLSLAANGARVLHPRSVAVAKRFDIRLVVCSSVHSTPGTVIDPMKRIEADGPVGLTHEGAVVLLTCRGSQEAMAALRRAWHKADVAVTHITTTGEGLRGVLGAAEVARCRSCIEEIGGELHVEMRGDLSVISVVASAVQPGAGWYAKVCDALEGVGVEAVYVQSSPLASTCVVPKQHLELALVTLHKTFGLDRDQAAQP